jgi:hypothetical protein
MKLQDAGHILIFKNRNRSDGSRSPEYRGALLLDGKTYDIGLWVYQYSSGMKFMSGSVVEIQDVLEHIKPNINDVHIDDL